MAENIYRPPLSGNKSMRVRSSKSKTYNKAEPEWHWALSPDLPKLWLRDSSKIDAQFVEDLELAWKKYKTLSIPGKGDGAQPWQRTRKARMKLEETYKLLPKEIKRAKEVALARYPGFVIRCEDGSLDYDTEVVEKRGGKKKAVVEALKTMSQSLKGDDDE